MENNLPIIKVWNIDWNFLIQNYCDPKLWDKKWILFQYKSFIISLCLNSINCLDKEICFRVKIEDKSEDREYYFSFGENYCRNDTRYTRYSLKTDDIKFLKKKINSTILELISDFERQNIRSLETYQDTKKKSREEKKILTRIAEDFLDKENVENLNIRQCYIDTYVDENTKIEAQLEEILQELKYTVFTDLYLAFVQSTKDEKLINRIQDEMKDINNIQDIKQEINDYFNYVQTEDYESDMCKNLEEL